MSQMNDNTTVNNSGGTTGNKKFIKLWWVIGLVLILILGGVAVAKTRSQLNGNKSTTKADPSIANDARINAENNKGSSSDQQNRSAADNGDVYSSDPVTKGKALSNGQCTGTGSVPLTSAPMKTSEMSVIIPYGLMAGGHVTPIDHQYYWGKEQMGKPDMYDVLAPADGHIVDVQYRDHSTENKPIKGDYRVVISYTCTFFSYFDLATSLSAEVQAALPKGWEQQPNTSAQINLAVKSGQVLGKVGGQSLDFAVWDTTKSLTHLLVPLAYNNREPWKIVTVPPLNYFSDEVKQQILPLYARTAEPQDGVIDQDVDGKLIGNWFKEGTNGYAGSTSPNKSDYWGGHLSFAKDHVDPSGGYVFSIGNWDGQAAQFGIINPSPKPEDVGVDNGLIKYQVGQWMHTLNGKQWLGEGPGAIKFSVGTPNGTVLVQMIDKRKLKVEVFKGKTPTQVSAFTDAAATYNRGDDAVK